MRIKRTAFQARFDIKRSNFVFQRRLLQSLAESDEVQPTVPPPSFGPIRSRLSEWQTDYNKYTADVASTQEKNQTTLEKLFPLSVNSARGPPPDNVEETFSTSEFVEYDTSNYDALGEMSEWMEKSFVKPGYLVEISPTLSRNEPELAVCVGKQLATIQLLTVRGKWVHQTEKNVRWTLPNWIDPKELKPLHPYIPQQLPSAFRPTESKIFEEATPAHILGPVVQKLNHFRDKALSIYRQHASTLDRAHDILASPTDLRIMPLNDIAELLIGKTFPDDEHATLWAVRRALLRNPNKIKPASKLTERNAQMFNIRSKEQVQIIEKVQKWLREYRDAVSLSDGLDIAMKHHLKQSDGFKLVDHFIMHSRELVLESRKLRDLKEDWFSPDKIMSDDFERHPRENGKFQHHESLIIQFLELWILGDSFQREPSLLSLPPFILSQIGLYNNRKPNSATGLCFLIEMGVLPPWTNKLLFNADLMLPCSQTNKLLESKYSKVHNFDSVKEDSAKGQLRDSLAGYRHDWGHLKVFCIDPPSAKEIDDGVSIEETENPNEFWVRVHIANPSAFLPASNEDATDLAASLHQTFYSPDSKWPMLPRYLGEHCSIRPGGPALSISAKLNLNGDMLDFDIRPGVVNNVFRLDYSTADTLIGRKPGQGDRWVVGAKSLLNDESKSSTMIPPNDAEKLSQLLGIAKKLCERRESNGAVNSGSRGQSFDVSVSSKPEYQSQIASPGLPFMYPNRKESFSFHGQPVIEVNTRPMFDPTWANQDEAFGAAEMVGEFMILAGSVAATWAKERNLPIVYRGALALKSKDEIIQFQRQHFMPGRRSENLIDYQYHRQITSHYGPAFGSISPFQHSMLGLSKYSKVTSPLRRYSDLVNHWQIGAALAFEHGTGKELSLEKDPGALEQYARQEGLPFRSEDDLQRLLPRFEEREKQIIHSTYYSNTFWLMQFLYRAVHHKEFDLPKVFRVGAIQVKVDEIDQFVAGKSLHYGIPMFLDRNESAVIDAGGIRYCDEWEAVIKGVDLEKFMLVVSPTRLVSRLDQTILDQYDGTVEYLSTLLPQLSYSLPQ